MSVFLWSSGPLGEINLFVGGSRPDPSKTPPDIGRESAKADFGPLLPRFQSPVSLHNRMPALEIPPSAVSICSHPSCILPRVAQNAVEKHFPASP